MSTCSKLAKKNKTKTKTKNKKTNDKSPKVAISPESRY